MNWNKIKPIEDETKFAMIRYLSSQYCLHPTITQHLFHLGVNTSKKVGDFLIPSLDTMHHPFLLDEMNIAVPRILQAIARQEQILVFGDYDCDGMTSSTILSQALIELGGHVDTRLPLRTEGYGLSKEIVNSLSKSYSLIITVDNGSSAHEALQAAKVKGIDVIVTDHHEVLNGRPDCLAFINPKRKDNNYPNANLCGAGVALKLVQAIYHKLNREWIGESFKFFDLATLGTIADVVPLIGENRIICWHGLRKIKNHPHPAFKKIMDKLRIKTVDSSTFGFTLGPIFNACGRIGDPNFAAAILRSIDPTNEEIDQLIALNDKRKKVTAEQFLTIQEKIQSENLLNDDVLVINGDFHKGIIGILASRVSNYYKKPTIVIASDGTGSARSLQGSQFSIINCISGCEDLLKKFGGHPMAAGFSINLAESQVNLFRSKIQKEALKQHISSPKQFYISNIPIHTFPKELMTDLPILEPYGMGMPKPIFKSNATKIASSQYFGKEKEHLKLLIKDKNVLGFSHAHTFHKIKDASVLDLFYSVNCHKKEDFFLHDLMKKEV
ncbi:single-stranded-DNA-specific exonuclease RecJ [Bacillus sp. AFS077874]|uniref:single-stranded-DNA-specific exonuclease RecJ n=1 Tax=unclassified Bacillus (in: firmicutes) TaxID=185979 RepID=UPI000BEBDAA5|nr:MULTISPECIES: single-stranded-DNA-specific exonuclease RecJ [unclassified Bacillus (in: firmicutes)]PEC47491.1 single-stranded-DNA-specific exonuclease RecJ [Bacillus sp. AFS096315]PFM76985.1 single-stranded-DNA-specific exonuclease RecJ [Bacillus sp. AFS077874]